MEKGKVDMELIRRYVGGELTPHEMYALERQAQADPMLMDIILGMEQEALDVHGVNLADIRRRIARRTDRRQTAMRRLAPAQRWAIAASILAVLTVGAWWFTRPETVEQQEAKVAATPKKVPQEAAPESAPSPEPVPPTAEREANAAPRRARTAPSAAAVSKEEEKKEERVALAAAKTSGGTALRDSVVGVGYGAQKKSTVVGAAARVAAAEMDAPVIAEAQALAGRTDGVRIRGISTPREHVHAQTITGKVVDGATHEPLMGVTIQVTDEHTVATDKHGRFTALDASQTLTARHIGYETQTVRIDGRDSMTIALRPSEAGLSEVVVVGYGQNRHQSELENVRHTESGPTPKEGWNAYRQYLTDAMKLAPDQKGMVELAFSIDGEGRPTAIKVLETTNDKLNAFATLIVRDGPHWLLGEQGEHQVTLRIAF